MRCADNRHESWDLRSHPSPAAGRTVPSSGSWSRRSSFPSQSRLAAVVAEAAVAVFPTGLTRPTFYSDPSFGGDACASSIEMPRSCHRLPWFSVAVPSFPSLLSSFVLPFQSTQLHMLRLRVQQRLSSCSSLVLETWTSGRVLHHGERADERSVRRLRRAQGEAERSQVEGG